jgi:hypothetical protein
MSHLDDLTDEQWGEVEAVVGETLETAMHRLKARRSSMPIDIDAALLLAGIAATVCGERKPISTPATTTEERSDD